jgi:hypothetical protein
MPDNEDKQETPAPSPQAEPMRPPPQDDSWITMDLIEKGMDQSGIEHRDQG